jgi:putative FmdB family regulatory protein
MPLYEYACDACGARFERIQKFSDPPASVCPTCGGGPIQKLISSPAFQFKGTGWYVTDYAKSGQKSESSPSSNTSKDASTRKDGSTTDSAPAKSSDSTKSTTDASPAKTPASGTPPKSSS